MAVYFEPIVDRWTNLTDYDKSLMHAQCGSINRSIYYTL